MHLVVGRGVRVFQRRGEARDREEERSERRAPLGTGVAPAVVKPRRLLLGIQRDGERRERREEEGRVGGAELRLEQRMHL